MMEEYLKHLKNQLWFYGEELVIFTVMYVCIGILTPILIMV